MYLDLMSFDNLLHGGQDEQMGEIYGNSQISILSNSMELILGGYNIFGGTVLS